MPTVLVWRPKRSAVAKRKQTQANEPAISELSLDNAMAFAIEMLKDGNVKPALTICERILQVEPRHADALHFQGMGLFQQGRHDEAVASVKSAVEALPTYTDAWNNLGNMHAQSDHYVEAEQAYRRVLALNPQHADAWNNLATALKEQDRLEDAEAAVREALLIDNKHPDAYQTLGNILRLRKRPAEALEAFKTAMTLRPQHPDSYRGLGAALYAVGQVAEAAEVYRRWLQIEPETPYAKHMLAACTQEAVPARAADDFVANTFDRFANSFDKVLEGLQYRAPQLIEQALTEYLGEGKRDGDVADAGCGTGLCGRFLRTYAKHLCGVDLSAAMVERAKHRKTDGDLPTYDVLYVEELTAFFRARPAAFDLIVSADTLCYFGDLAAPVQAMSQALRPGGLLSFTVEYAEEAEAPHGFRIHPHGRYSQTEPYVRQELKQAKLSAKLVHPVHLRMEKGQPVAGLLVLAKAQR